MIGNEGGFRSLTCISGELVACESLDCIIPVFFGTRKFLRTSITRCFDRRLTNFTSSGRGGGTAAASSVISCRPRRWETAISSKARGGSNFIRSLQSLMTFSSFVPGSTSGRPNMRTKSLRPCCSRSFTLVCSSINCDDSGSRCALNIGSSMSWYLFTTPGCSRASRNCEVEISIVAGCISCDALHFTSTLFWYPPCISIRLCIVRFKLHRPNISFFGFPKFHKPRTILSDIYRWLPLKTLLCFF